MYQLQIDNDFYKGVVPATDFLKDSGIGMTDRGFIPVDKVMWKKNQTEWGR